MKEQSQIKTRGRTFVGEVISAKTKRTVTIKIERRHYLKKYERYEKRTTKIKAHSPDELGIKEGDTIKIMETRPISKTKKFIAVEKIEKDQKKEGKK